MKLNAKPAGSALRHHPEVSDGGLPGWKGVFLACSFWLTEALLGIGRRDKADELFERLLELRNVVACSVRNWAPMRKRQLGNTPQAATFR